MLYNNSGIHHKYYRSKLKVQLIFLVSRLTKKVNESIVFRYLVFQNNLNCGHTILIYIAQKSKFEISSVILMMDTNSIVTKLVVMGLLKILRKTSL